ncbi:UvrABC system protein C [Iodidimonas muriae]|uniref:UvrABC system protein C n=1 Tax=Iodidimonas muriae TaxID=261467 RepID=A0ABQ2LAT8_9PROT|nr:excinuclease ABC subunit UvrC [Iodidimonas muriae]GER08085.1 UvrABC system protein C [Kordiimonadales bacterium JCM 17843]GGO08903.1 UvrABC system protein C [Iodidimonas muriae]
MTDRKKITDRQTGTPDNVGLPKEAVAPQKNADHAPIGADAIRHALKTAPRAPGVYRMMNAHGDVLYVGKAKNIRSRVSNYTRPNGLGNRIGRMVSQTRSMEFVTTHTEADALLLEANLIKRLKPPFNVLLRDDKSFPYIVLKNTHHWPQIAKHRGARGKDGLYFGPFASASSVNRTLNTLQRIFLLRTCSDAVLENRSRPCLLYQIKRCSAPCVGRISKADYDQLVADALAFLEGRDTGIQKRLAADMMDASDALDFETAAILRDRLKALAHVQSHQGTTTSRLDDADVIAAVMKGGQVCIQVFFFRAGQNRGNRAFFPRHAKDDQLDDVLSAFLAQFYVNKPPPRQILLNETPANMPLLAQALSVAAEHMITLHLPQRGAKRDLVIEAERNAVLALDRKLADAANESQLLAELADILHLDSVPNRIEVYDNSHIQGSHALGAMIVSGAEGFDKSQYRRFNIKSTSLTPGDDFAMMREVMTRRFSRLLKEDPDRSRGLWPDLMLIDGGKGQLSAVLEVAQDYGVTEDVDIVAISKGPDRHAGREQFHKAGHEAFMIRPGHPALYYLQRLRDEAHRFAIGGHRAKRSRAIVKSPLDDLAGIGPKRKRALLHHFGSASGVADAALKDLELVDGISKAMARQIYDHFHAG